MKLSKKVVFLIILNITFSCYCQNGVIDSLLKELKKWENTSGLAADTNLYLINLEVAKDYFNRDLDTSLIYANKSLKYALNVNDTLKIVLCKMHIATILMYKGDNQSALKIFLSYLPFIEAKLKISPHSTKYLNTAGNMNNRIGYLYYLQSNIEKALNYNFVALKQFEIAANKNAKTAVLANIGNAYTKLNEHKNAIKYYQQAKDLAKSQNNLRQLDANLLNLGISYSSLNLIKEAESYYLQAINSNDVEVLANCYNGLGTLYQEKKEYTRALLNFKNSYEKYKIMQDMRGESIALNNIANVHILKKEYSKAEQVLLEAIQIGSQQGMIAELDAFYENLHEVYFNTNRPALALAAYKKHVLYRDSLKNEENQKALITKEMQYEFDKKQTADSLKTVQEKKVAQIKYDEEKSKNKLRIILGSSILFLLLLFTLLMYNRFKAIQKQKVIIELKEKETQFQKHVIEEKHKAITDSINYAERIQRSFLATKEHLDLNLRNYFILFKPKDVVSGDFYWSATLNNGLFALAIADSTGHGVPGAIMSLLNISSLEKAIETNVQPSDILNATRKTIIERLKKDGSPDGGKDGMDCSLLCFDFTNMKLSISAANNPVWIVRPKPEASAEALEAREATVIEIKPDKMPVGKHDKDQIPFTQQEIQLQKGDVIYTLTDGFPDQFGGEKGKKFMSKNLKELLAANAHLPMQVQKQLLESTFIDWVGNLEQVDDVTLIGIRI